MKAPAQNAAEKSSPEPPTVTARGAHHRVWQRERLVTLPDGRTVNRPAGFTELATGLHYFENGQWQESRAEFAVTPTGAAATRGPHQVFLTGNINTPGAIEIRTADRRVLKFRPVCLAYTDTASGRSVVLAPVRDAEGILFPPNEVLYPAAFTGVRADVRVTYTKAGFESDVILREKLPPPEDYGLDTATTLLEVWHEGDAPAPEKSARSVDGLTDETLRFGLMRIGRGTAFSLDATARRHHGPPVSKTWLRTENPARSYLIESVRLPRVQKELDELPDRQAALPQRPPGWPLADPVLPINFVGDDVRSLALLGQKQMDPPHVVPYAARSRLAQLATLFPPSARTATPVRLAFDMKAVAPAHGLVLDYAVMNSQTDPLTLQADTTYLVSDPVSLTDLIIEGGTVVKYAAGWGAYVEFYGTVDCQTGPYRPAIFTAQDDDTVGEIIPGSTGTPSGWSITPNLISGSNSLHVIGYDRKGQPLPTRDVGDYEDVISLFH